MLVIDLRCRDELRPPSLVFNMGVLPKISLDAGTDTTYSENLPYNLNIVFLIELYLCAGKSLNTSS
jgi:hypothetical protein